VASLTWGCHFLPVAFVWTLSLSLATAQEAGVASIPVAGAAVKLDEADNAARSHLERIQRYLADGQWDEAVEALRGLMDASGERLVALPPDDARGGGEFVRFVPLHQFGQGRLATFAQEAPQALEAYRQRVDPLAEAWLKRAVAERDPQRLQEVADRFFASRSGDDALLRLGDIELEQGNFARARRAWQQLSPPPAGPAAPPPWLAYPKPDLDLDAVRARLVLVSILEGSPARAERELELLIRLAPEAQGTLGGQSGRYGELLSDLLAASRTWPAQRETAEWTTLGGSAARNKTAAAAVDVALRPIWSVPLPRRPANDSASAGSKPEGTEGWLGYHPLVSGAAVLIATGDTLDDIHGYDLDTGRPLWLETSLPPDAVAQMQPSALPGVPSSGRSGTPQYTLTVAGNHLYAKLGPQATSLAASDRRETPPLGYLAALDLQADKKLLFEIRLDQPPWGEGWSVEGVPLAANGRLYVALRQRDGVRTQSHVAAFDSKRGELIWQRFVAAAESSGQGPTVEFSHNLLALAEGVLYLNTNFGVVAAVRARDGQMQWVTQYPQIASDAPESEPPRRSSGRGLTPCVLHKGLVLTAPSDCDRVFALDAVTGQKIWDTPPGTGADIQYLLGVGSGNLIASGSRLVWIDVQTGEIKARFPTQFDAALRGYGRGILAGNQVYWPTRDQICVFDQRGPQQTRQPLELAPLGLTGGNLVISRDVLLIAGPGQLSAFNTFGPQMTQADGTQADGRP
jgi:outer membrane protein assembly factor BamB